MNAIALALDRMYSEVHSHIDEVEQLLCFGATPWESVLDYIKNAVAAGMTHYKLIDGGGTRQFTRDDDRADTGRMNPQSAVRYQFIVMVMIAASVAIGCLLIVGLSYKKMFNEEMALIDEIRRN